MTANIEKIITGNTQTTIDYSHRDEFAPLIDTIHSLQQTLSYQESIRSTFLSDLSHEIKTPITALKCYLEAIEDGVMDLDSQMTTLLARELARLIQTTDRIMSYEHLSHQSREAIAVTLIELRPLITDLITEYHPQLMKRNQNIIHHLTKKSSILMDGSLLLQILHNIFSNFVKYA